MLGSGKKPEKFNQNDKILLKDVTNFKEYSLVKRTIFTVRKVDNYCLLRAVIIAKEIYDSDNQKSRNLAKPNSRQLNKLVKIYARQIKLKNK